MKMDFCRLLISTSLIILSSVFSQAQTAVFKCDDARYFDRHTADEGFNALIDSACIMLNKKKYDIALRLLNSAVILDSTKNAGALDIYISSQRNKLAKFITAQNEKPEVEAEIVEAQPGAKVNETPSPKEDETPAPKVEETPALKVEETPAPKVEETPAPKVEETPAPKVEETPAPKVVETPAKKVEEVSPPLIDNTKPESTKKEDGVDPFVENTNKEKPTQDETALPTKTFSEDEKNEFQSKGLQKVTELEGYLKQICDKETSQSIAEEVTIGALSLFDSEDRVVQVSSLNSGVKVRLKIRKYLEKLRMLPYDNVRIEWAEFQYTSDFIKGDDGNYHGYVIFRQRFSASKDQQVVYSDMTTKKAEVILKLYKKAIEGIETEKWDVFLGDISVEQTAKN